MRVVGYGRWDAIMQVLKGWLRIADFILRVMGFTGMVVFEEFPKLLSLFA